MSKFDAGASFDAPAKVALEHKQLGVIYERNPDGTIGGPGWLLVKSDKHPDLIRLENREKQEAVVRANAERRGQKTDVKLEDVEGKSLNYLMLALVDWGVGEGEEAQGGKLVNLSGHVFDAPCDEENKREVLADPAWRWLRACLDEAIVQDRVFMPNSRLFSALTQKDDSSLES